MTKYLQVLTGLLILLLFHSCGAVKVEPVEEGESLRYHARVGYFLHPPQRIDDDYILNLSKYSDTKDFKRCEPSTIVRIHSRFEQRYVEISQGENVFMFDTIAGKPIQLAKDKYTLIDRLFKKDFPLPTDIVTRKGVSYKKSELLCAGKVWVGMNKDEFLIARHPPDNIIKKIIAKKVHENWQYETKNHFLREYKFVDGILQTHYDD